MRSIETPLPSLRKTKAAAPIDRAAALNFVTDAVIPGEEQLNE